MRRFKRSIIAVGLAALGMLATNTPPASAVSTGTIDFSVIVTTPPLGYPEVSSPGSGAVAVTSTTACAGASAGKKAIAGTCSISGAGNIGAGTVNGTPTTGAFCGHSGGWITGTIRITEPVTNRTEEWNYTIHFVTAGGVITATGTITDPDTGQTGPIVVEGVAVPNGDPVTNPGGGSCAAGTANQFRVVGTATSAKA